jgi:hypothetical protein
MEFELKSENLGSFGICWNLACGTIITSSCYWNLNSRIFRFTREKFWINHKIEFEFI